jgi:hypothetical protein
MESMSAGGCCRGFRGDQGGGEDEALASRAVGAARLEWKAPVMVGPRGPPGRMLCNNGAKAAVPEDRMTSGASAANSAARSRMVSGWPSPQNRAFLASCSKLACERREFERDRRITSRGPDRQLVSTGVLRRKASSSICLTRKSATSAREMNPHVQSRGSTNAR